MVPASVHAALAALVRRIFNMDIELCPRCGGRLKIIADIVDPQVTVKILTPWLARPR
jgi:hypothetical protein